VTQNYSVILDDREEPPAEVRRVSGDVHYGDLLRRRRRYLDELKATAADADEVIVLRTHDEAEQLARRIETDRSSPVWLWHPTRFAPVDFAALRLVIAKMRYALDPMLLAPLKDDDAPLVMFAHHVVPLLRAETAKARRTQFLQIADQADVAAQATPFLNLREPAALGQFLTGATEPRAFNALAAEKDIFVKSSTDIAKMRGEHDFYALASPALQRFLLPAFDFKEDGKTASYRMENLRVPDAALQFVLGSFSKDQFDQLLDHFFTFISTRDKDVIGRDKVRAAGQTQIIAKLAKRLDQMTASDAAPQIDAMLGAGGISGGMRGLVDRAIPLAEKALTACSADYLAFSHGDPCLSNILFDGRTGLFRLIDPRGATGRDDAMMHPLYDIAKLSHSVLGGYDFINNDLFGVEVGSALGLELQLHRGGPPEWVKAAFQERLATEGWDLPQVRAVEATLFLSMLPLHLDHARKPLGFCLVARNILDALEAA